MNGRLFVHYPPCSGASYKKTWDIAIGRHHMLSAYDSRADIMSKEHCMALIAEVDKAERGASVGFYPAYALLYLLTRGTRPPSPFALFRRKDFNADRARLQYHSNVASGCAAGIFVVGKSGRWPFDMWRNARHLLRKKKPVWVLTQDVHERWHIAEVSLLTLQRNVRMGRRETLACIGEFVDNRDTLGLSALFQKN